MLGLYFGFGERKVLQALQLRTLTKQQVKVQEMTPPGQDFLPLDRF
jgi:hypothetical protein